MSPIDTDRRYKDAYVPEPRVYTVNGAANRTNAAAAVTVAARPLLDRERLEAQEVVIPFTPTEWRMTFDGESPSLWPSIRNCNCPAARTMSSTEAVLSGQIRGVTTRLPRSALAKMQQRPSSTAPRPCPGAETTAQRSGPGKVYSLGVHQPLDWDTLMRTAACRRAGDGPIDSVAAMLGINLG